MEDTLEQTILVLVHASAGALARHDVEYFARLLDHAFVYINANGEAVSKQEYVQRYVEPPEMLRLSQTLEGTQCASMVDVAILTGYLHDRLTFAGDPFEGDQWRCVSGHTSQRAQET